MAEEIVVDVVSPPEFRLFLRENYNVKYVLIIKNLLPAVINRITSSLISSIGIDSDASMPFMSQVMKSFLPPLTPVVTS